MAHTKLEDLERIAAAHASQRDRPDQSEPTEHAQMRLGDSLAYLTHTEDGTAALVVVDGEKQASIILDEDDKINTVTHAPDTDIVERSRGAAAPLSR